MAVDRARVRALYDSTLQPRIAGLETLRVSLKGYIVRGLLLTAGPVLLFANRGLFTGTLSDAASIVVSALLFVAIFVGVGIAGFKYAIPGLTAYINYTARFKHDVVSEIFKVVSPDATYAAEQGISAAIFDAPGIFSTTGGTRSDDRVTGTIGVTPFEAAEVKRSYTTGGKNSTTHIVFHGLFFHLDFNKALTGLTIVQPEGSIPCELGSRDGLKKVQLESPEFERQFAVYTSNDVEARYILTPAMMERILALRQHAEKPIFLAFKGNRAYLAVHFGRSLFEPSIGATTSRDAIEEMAEHFGLAEFVVQELDLNTRIWTKGVDTSILQRKAPEASGLMAETIAKGGAIKESDLFEMATSASGVETEHEAAERPAGTGITVETSGGGLTVSYGFRTTFWVSLVITILCALVVARAIAALPPDLGLGAIAGWAKASPAIGFLDGLVSHVPVAWIVGGVIIGLGAMMGWLIFVRKVIVTPDAILVYRGLRPFPRSYSRSIYGKVVRMPQAVYVAKREGFSLVNVTVSPNLNAEESRWLAWEFQRVLGAEDKKTNRRTGD